MKNLKIISNDLELHKNLENISAFKSVTIETDFSQLEDVDILIVSDRIISFNRFLDLYEDIKNIKFIYYMLSNNEEHNFFNINSILQSKNIKIIPPKLTINQIIEKICIDIGAEIKFSKNIVTFLGSDSDVGVTMTSLSIAEDIATHINGKVLYLPLNGQTSTDFLNSESTSIGIDSLKTKIINKILSSNELLDTCYKKDNLYVLPGTEIIYEARFYHPEHIENLMLLVSQEFDVVIIDAGTNLSLGMAIGALNSTSFKYLVTTQQDNAKRNWDRLNEQILHQLGISSKDFLIIINKFINNSELYTSSQLAELYNSTSVGNLPFLEYGWQAERDRKSLLHYNNKEYNDSISSVSKILCSQLQVEYKENETKYKTSFLSRWLK